MVKPATRAVLPQQPTREALALQQSLEDNRRTSAVRGVERVISYTRAADAAAGNTSDNAMYNAASRLSLGRGVFIPDAAVTANAGNFATFELYSYDPAGGASTTLGSFSTSQKSIAKGEARAFELDQTDVPAGHTLALRVTKTLGGVSLPQGRLVVEATEGDR